MAPQTEPGAGWRRRHLIQGAAALTLALAAGPGRAQEIKVGNYLNVDGLDLYFEDHGADRSLPPVVLLHGALYGIETAWGDLLPRLADRRVIAIEAQGHGHTADRATPFTEAQMVADAAGVLDQLGIAGADIVGHSMGAIAAGGLAIRRPELVRSLTLLGRSFSPEGTIPELLEMQRNPQHLPSAELAAILPTQAEFGAWAEHYRRTAPNPGAFQQVAMKAQAYVSGWPGWSHEQLAAIPAPALIVIGDRDFVPPAHAAELAALLPGSQLAILPGTTHTSILRRGAWLEPMLRARWDRLG
ncbi:alpha/beta fold hydrolase [Devosia sp.]|uniref:alpha/beta fold hydrolase n=1 Tax=Devosia sp. TaxID=1871048 RepID=UPI003F6EADAD